jgi:hypothetical protein
VEQTPHLFDSSFLKVSVDQFSQNRYIPINNLQGGGADISSFGEDKANCSFILVSEENIREIQQKQG